MTAVQPAGAGDAIGPEDIEGGGERVGAGEVRAIGAGAGRDLRMAVEEERNVAALDHGRDRFGAGYQRALVALLEAKENGGDVAGCERRVEAAGKSGGVAQKRSDEVKPRRSALRRRRPPRNGGRCDVTPLSAQDRLSTDQAPPGRSSWHGGRRRAGPPRCCPTCRTTPSAARLGARGRRRKSRARAARPIC